MEDIIEPTMDYDFTKIYFGPPSTLAGGAYFAKIMYSTNKPLLIQTPKSLTKQGFVKSGKKVYTDLMFDNNDTVFINWIENLESKCQELVYLKRESWFETKLEKDDIETAFTSPFKIFKSGKYYLLRVNVKQNLKIYDEMNKIIQTESITNDKTIISILEIQGLKFTSRNFQIEIELKQSMVVSPDPFLDACFIKKPNKKQSSIIEDLEDLEDLEEVEEVENLVKNNNKSDNLFATPLTKQASLTSAVESFSNIDLDKKTEMNTAINSKTNVSPVKNADIQLGDITNLDLKSDSNIDNIILEIEDLSAEPVKIEESDMLKEFDLSSSLEDNLESITLKKPNQVYYEIYKKAREKAKEAKKEAILAFLEAKNIKKTYMLDEIDESDEDEDLNFNEIEDIEDI